MTVKTRSMSTKRQGASGQAEAAKKAPTSTAEASSRSMDAARESLQSAAKGASYNVLLQVIQ